MDGIHDVGGMEGFGRVTGRTPSEPVFVEDWERRALRASLAALAALQPGGADFRHSIERMNPAHYLGSSYYEHWLTGVSTLLVEAGVVSQQELERRAGAAFPLSGEVRKGTPVEPVLDQTTACFAVGDRVRVREWHPIGHTRAPRYVQGKRGVIVRVDEPANLPDMEAQGGPRVLNPTYSVRFSSTELWGQGGGPAETVHVDLWEHYLEEDT